MFDPTIFDNLKVVLEGGLYDLEREDRIRLLDRQDLLDLASMSRAFRMRFSLPDGGSASAEIELASDLSDFAAELARLRIVGGTAPGCQIRIRYRLERWQGDEQRLLSMMNLLHEWWSEEVEVWQVIETTHHFLEERHEQESCYTAGLKFLRKIDEQHIEQLPRLLEHSVWTLRQLLQFWQRG